MEKKEVKRIENEAEKWITKKKERNKFINDRKSISFPLQYIFDTNGIEQPQKFRTFFPPIIKRYKPHIKKFRK